MLDNFVAFALAPSEVTAARVPFSKDGVQLGLGARLVATLASDSVPQAEAWAIAGGYGGIMGPFSALSSIATHVDGVGVDPALRRNSELTLSAGEHGRCASPPGEMPGRLDHLRQVSIQPAQDSITSCIGWFAVDLFLTETGTVDAVIVDYWEP